MIDATLRNHIGLPIEHDDSLAAMHARGDLRVSSVERHIVFIASSHDNQQIPKGKDVTLLAADAMPVLFAVDISESQHDRFVTRACQLVA